MAQGPSPPRPCRVVIPPVCEEGDPWVVAQRQGTPVQLSDSQPAGGPVGVVWLRTSWATEL